ncbi:hypothetical protein NPS33_24595 [Pseudomonas putida]|nr:hypothetical protein [Pseudomonas putida]MDD2018029.1 hypothetical protein [Pseudomonas putida]
MNSWKSNGLVDVPRSPAGAEAVIVLTPKGQALLASARGAAANPA